jgi:hypothetical protein
VAKDAPHLFELARRSVAGDAKATRGLLIAVGAPMFRAAAKILARHSAETEDVVQDAMEAVDARPAGALAAEAVFGRARCLDSLGRPDEGAEAWRRLLRHFPRSICGSTARRLAELDR